MVNASVWFVQGLLILFAASELLPHVFDGFDLLVICCVQSQHSFNNMLYEGLKLAIARTLSPEMYPENPYMFELPISQWTDWMQLRLRDVNWRIKTQYTSSMFYLYFTSKQDIKL